MPLLFQLHQQVSPKLGIIQVQCSRNALLPHKKKIIKTAPEREIEDQYKYNPGVEATISLLVLGNLSLDPVERIIVFPWTSVAICRVDYRARHFRR